MRRSTLLFALVHAWAIASAAPTDTAPSRIDYSEQVAVQLIQVDVTVWPPAEDPGRCLGLTKDDFRLTVDRRPRPIEAVDWLGASGASRDTGDPSLADPTRQPMMVVLFFDLWHLNLFVRNFACPLTKALAFEEARGMVREELVAGDRLLLVTFAGWPRVHYGWIDDPGEALAALVRLEVSPPVMSARTEHLHEQPWIDGMESLLLALGRYPGAKELIYLGDDFRFGDLASRVDELAAGAQANHVTIHAVDLLASCRGMAGPGRSRTCPPVGGLYCTPYRVPIALGPMSWNTGGQLFGTASVGTAVRRIREMRGCRYVVSFLSDPEEERRAAPRAIVTLNRKGLTLRAPVSFQNPERPPVRRWSWATAAEAKRRLRAGRAAACWPWREGHLRRSRSPGSTERRRPRRAAAPGSSAASGRTSDRDCGASSRPRTRATGRTRTWNSGWSRSNPSAASFESSLHCAERSRSRYSLRGRQAPRQAAGDPAGRRRDGLPRAARPSPETTLTPHVTELEITKPGSSEAEIGHAVSRLDRSIATYIERCRKKIPAFVESNFTLEQSWRLQRPTLWFDLASAPLNSAWALPHLAAHKATDTLERVGYPRLAQWVKVLPPGIKTGYQRQIERLICTDLLEWDRERHPAALPRGFLRELEAVPALRNLIETPELQESHRACARTLADLLRQFSSGRALVSDLSGAFLTLMMSWWILGSTSLSLSGIAHGAAQKSAHDRAASRFFLGKKLGSHFYNVFQPKVHENTMWTILILLGVGLTVGAMACTILSDPIRKILGFHRNRLEILLNQVERELIVFSHKRIQERLRG